MLKEAYKDVHINQLQRKRSDDLHPLPHRSPLNASHNSNILTFHPTPHCLLATGQRWPLIGCTDPSAALPLVAFSGRKNCSVGRVAALAGP